MRHFSNTQWASSLNGLMRPGIKTKSLFCLFCSAEQFLLAARLMIHLFTLAESVLADSCSCPKAHFLWWDYNDSPYQKYSLGISSFMLHGETWPMWGPSPNYNSLYTSFLKGQFIIKVKFESFTITLPKQLPLVDNIFAYFLKQSLKIYSSTDLLFCSWLRSPVLDCHERCKEFEIWAMNFGWILI